jgi:hypothetical protein
MGAQRALLQDDPVDTSAAPAADTLQGPVRQGRDCSRTSASHVSPQMSAHPAVSAAVHGIPAATCKKIVVESLTAKPSLPAGCTQYPNMDIAPGMENDVQPQPVRVRCTSCAAYTDSLASLLLSKYVCKSQSSASSSRSLSCQRHC